MLATRFAPSPTGEDIHIGNLRVAVLNHQYARNNKGVFVLRIEDTVNDRLVESCKSRIVDTLMRMGMEPDIMIMQSAHKEKHLDVAHKLLAEGVLYEKDGALWFPAGGCSYTDENYGEMYDVWDEFVCIRSNGEPSFIFANLLDDLELMEKYELHVIRGNDHIHNTFKQVGMCECMKRRAPSYCSVPMILGSDGRPLSKRDNAGTVGKMLDMGVVPECLYKYLCELGNGKSPARMDLKKLLSMNRSYMTPEVVCAYEPLCAPYYALIKTHIRCFRDLEMFSYLWKAPVKNIACDFSLLFQFLKEEKPVDMWVSATGMERREAYSLLRQALCGSPYSLDLNIVVKALDEEELRRRLL